MSNPFQSPATEELADFSPAPAWLAATRRAKTRLLWAMLVLFTAAGLASAFIPEESRAAQVVDFGTALVFAGMIVKWCQHDSAERGLALWAYFVPMMILCPGPLILMPIYLCRTRGAQGLVSTLLAAGFFVLLLALSVAGAVVGLALQGALEV